MKKIRVAVAALALAVAPHGVANAQGFWGPAPGMMFPGHHGAFWAPPVYIPFHHDHWHDPHHMMGEESADAEPAPSPAPGPEPSPENTDSVTVTLDDLRGIEDPVPPDTFGLPSGPGTIYPRVRDSVNDNRDRNPEACARAGRGFNAMLAALLSGEDGRAERAELDVALAACGFAAPAAPSPALIELEQGACFGTCPVYKISVLDNGFYELQAGQFTANQGSSTGTLPLGSYRAALTAIKAANFDALPSDVTRNNPAACGAPVATDLPTTIITVDDRAVTYNAGCTQSPHREALDQLVDDLREAFTVEALVTP